MAKVLDGVGKALGEIGVHFNMARTTLATTAARTSCNQTLPPTATCCAVLSWGIGLRELRAGLIRLTGTGGGWRHRSRSTRGCRCQSTVVLQPRSPSGRLSGDGPVSTSGLSETMGTGPRMCACPHRFPPASAHVLAQTGFGGVAALAALRIVALDSNSIESLASSLSTALLLPTNVACLNT